MFGYVGDDINCIRSIDNFSSHNIKQVLSLVPRSGFKTKQVFDYTALNSHGYIYRIASLFCTM